MAVDEPLPGETRSLRALLTAVFFSSMAIASYTTVLGKQVYDLTGSVFDLGLLGLAQFAPAALLVLVTGSVADRVDRRTIVMVGFVTQATFLSLLSLYARTDPTSTVPIFVLVVLLGTTQAFVTPALRSLPADTVLPGRLPRLAARQAATWQAAAILGPVMGGFLYVVGVPAPYLASAFLALCGSVIIRFVHPRPKEVEPAPTHERGQLWEAVAGIRFVRSQPILLGAISLDLFAVLFGGAIALLPAIADDRLGVGAVGLGWLRASVGIGASLVTLVLAFRPVHRRVGSTLLIAVAGFGVGTIVLGLTRSYVVAFIALMVLSGADSVSVFIRSTLVPLVTPPNRRGRVLAVEAVFIGASNELGAFESGVAGQLLGPAGAVVLGGAATLLVAVLWWRLFPKLRDVDTFPSAPEIVI
jgi:MFS family permease